MGNLRKNYKKILKKFYKILEKTWEKLRKYCKFLRFFGKMGKIVKLGWRTCRKVVILELSCLNLYSKQFPYFHRSCIIV